VDISGNECKFLADPVKMSKPGPNLFDKVFPKVMDGLDGDRDEAIQPCVNLWAPKGVDRDVSGKCHLLWLCANQMIIPPRTKIVEFCLNERREDPVE
jgi:hypothetical protein